MSRETNFSLLRRTLRACLASLRKNPVALLLLHLPLALTDVLQLTLSEDYLQQRFTLSLLLALLVILCTTFSESITVLYLQQAREGLAPRMTNAFKRLKQLGLPFVTSTVTLGVLLIASMYAYVFPFFYVGAIFLFVPAFIVTEPSPTIWPAFNRSVQMSRKRLFFCITATTLSFIFLYSLQELEVWTLSEVTLRELNSFNIQLLFLGVIFGVSCVVNTFFSMFVSHLFFFMKEEP